jgi:putative ABC transport system ATP-binding protein
MALMRDLNQTQSQTFIIVTHDPGIAESTERTIYLNDGVVVRDERHPCAEPTSG